MIRVTVAGGKYHAVFAKYLHRLLPGDGLLDISSAWAEQDRSPCCVTGLGMRNSGILRVAWAAVSAEIEPNSRAGPWATRGRPLSPAAPFPWPPDSRGAPPSWGWVPLARSRPGEPRFGRMSEIIGGCKMSVALRHGIWTFGHFRVMVKKARRPLPPQALRVEP